MDAVTQRIFDYVRERFEIGDDPDFTTDAHLFDNGFVDSLGATEIVFFIEDEYGIRITQKDITLYAMNTIDEIAAVVKRKLEEK